MHEKYSEECERCGKPYSTKYDLKKHKQKCDGQPMPEMIQEAPDLFYCVLCRQKFKTAERCTLHRTKCTPETAAESNSYKFYCEKCNKRFPIQKYVYRHQKQFCEFVDASQKYMHQCEVCLHRFSSKSNYNRHRKINKCGGPNLQTGNNSNQHSDPQTNSDKGDIDTNAFQLSNYVTMANQAVDGPNSSMIQKHSPFVTPSNPNKVPTVPQVMSNKGQFDNDFGKQPPYQELLFGGLVNGIFQGSSSQVPVFPEITHSNKNKSSQNGNNANLRLPTEIKSYSEQPMNDSATSQCPKNQLNLDLSNQDLFGGLVPGIPGDSCMFPTIQAQMGETSSPGTEKQVYKVPQETQGTNPVDPMDPDNTEIKKEVVCLDQDVSLEQGDDPGEPGLNNKSENYKDYNSRETEKEETKRKKGSKKSNSPKKNTSCYCKICLKSFCKEEVYLGHMIQKHPDSSEVSDLDPDLILKHVCHKCGVKFACKSALKTHEKRHEEKARFSCDYEGCTSTFSIKQSLVVHKKTHTGERELCPQCGKAFTQKGQYCHVKHVLKGVLRSNSQIPFLMDYR